MVINNNFDSIIIGSGIAGLSLAYRLAQAGQRVFICSKEAITEGSSNYAQAGVAVVSPDNPEDKLESHIQDTLDSGKGLCNEDVVRSIIELSWAKIDELIKLGVEFDKSFNIEGSHSYKRVMHVGDATGRAIIKPLIDSVSRNLNISISQGTEALSLIKDKAANKIIGARFQAISGDEFDIEAEHTILATGGLGALYLETTNSNILTGDGIALAYDAGAKIENLEFIQFHPTVFKTKPGDNFLISEALRGAGAQLRNSRKELFAEKYHPDAELATRDIVSRAISSEMKATDSEYIYVDATNLSKEFLLQEFPNIYSKCLENGYDLIKDLLPVRPAAHYSIGGIKTDLSGRTNVNGLYAIGECASNGLHGANRLASNSLLECIVVPALMAEAILEPDSSLELISQVQDTMSKAEQILEGDKVDVSEIEYCSDYGSPVDYESQLQYQETVDKIRYVMSKNLGIERRQKSIQSTIKYLENIEDCKEKTTALLIAKSALLRKESRGAHFRIDAPKTNSAYARSTILSKESVAKRMVKQVAA